MNFKWKSYLATIALSVFSVFQVQSQFINSSYVSYNPPIFHAIAPDPYTFEMKGVLVGQGVLTEASTSVRLQPDHENIWRYFASTVPAWYKGRVVENLFFRFRYAQKLVIFSLTAYNV